MFHPMMRWTPTTTLTRRKLLACSLLLAMLACAALPGVSEASRRVRGPGYSTIVPNHWKILKANQGGWRAFRAFYPGTRRNVTKNSLSVGVSVISVKNLERTLGHKLPDSLIALEQMVVGSPAAAQNLTVVAPIRAIDLRGEAAAAGAASYVLGGTAVLQSNIISRHHNRVYFIQLDVDLSRQFLGTQALGRTRSHWRWH